MATKKEPIVLTSTKLFIVHSASTRLLITVSQFTVTIPQSINLLFFCCLRFEHQPSIKRFVQPTPQH